MKESIIYLLKKFLESAEQFITIVFDRDDAEQIIERINALEVENARLQEYSMRLLSEESRIWRCDKCGDEFSSCFKGEWQSEIDNVVVKCPECDTTAHTLSSVLRNENARLRAYITALESEPVRSKSVIKRLKVQTGVEGVPGNDARARHAVPLQDEERKNG